jgi:xanthine dehydrogenase YagR molybdenum-binding subunit
MPKVKTKVGFRGKSKDLEVTIPDNEPAPWGLDAQLRYVGTDVRRIDGVLKITGRAKYTYDVRPPGMLWGKILHSPWGAAKIKALDLKAAKALPGVRAVHVFKDVGRPLLYHGDEILAIAADTEEIAEDAIRAVKIEYDRKPVATTVQAAMKDDAPMVFEGEKNVKPGKPTGEKAKVDAAMKGAAKTVEAVYETQVQTHSALEPHGSTALFEKDGSLTLYVSTQGTFQCKGDAVNFSKLPDDKVRAVAEMVGGGFGSKFSIGRSGQAAIALARETKRPVKVMCTREGEHLTGGNRPSSLQKVKAGLRPDGKFVAYAVEAYGTAGINGGGAGVANPVIYDTGEKWKQESTVVTNGGPAAAFRSPSWPQGVFALESFLDECAHALAMDPLELRRKNTEDEVYLAQWELGAKMIGWDRRNKVPGAGKGVVKRGIGMASSMWRQMGGPGCEVDVLIHKDGTVEAKNGAQDIGTGTRTLIAIIVAEELGLKPTDIKVSLGDTRWPKGPGSGGSKTAPTVGPAARNAAFLAKKKLLELASAKLDVPASELALRDGRVAGKGKSLTFAEAAALIKGEPISVRGARSDNYDSYMKQVHGAQFAEVEVDTETGHVKVVKVVAIQDAGRVINKLLFESQLVGGVIQGISYGLLEDRILDGRYGVQMNADLMMYKIAASMEMPEIVPVAFDVANAGNNCGMMGLGEPPNIPTAAALGNAIFNATGLRLRQLPMTPDKVLAAAAAAASKGPKRAAI